jgi:hypothetical protein|tara:strand:- start:143 stop:502 length:360 start_codon:yes stop_codon:yes gene_type:complete
MKITYSTILIKRNGQLEQTIKAKGDTLDQIIKDMPEGTKVEVFANTIGGKGSKAQLAKIHAMIRQLSDDVGDDIISMKAEVKIRANMDKSFADCDKEELNSVIQVIYAMGDFLGSNLRD